MDSRSPEELENRRLYSAEFAMARQKPGQPVTCQRYTWQEKIALWLGVQVIPKRQGLELTFHPSFGYISFPLGEEKR